MITKDLLDLESLSELYVLAGGGGMNRRISSVSVMDAPDICNWMRGGEFLITSGFIIENHPIDFKEFILKLNEAHVAALGIKLDRFIHKIPEKVLDIANELDFPILYIPIRYTWVEIIYSVLTEIVNSQAIELELSEKIHNSFIALALEKKSIQDVIDQLSSIIKKDVMYKDYVFPQIYLSPKADLEKFTAKTTFKNQVAKGGKHLGYLYVLIDTNKFKDKNMKFAIEHACTVLILMTQEKMSNRMVEFRYRSELIHDILSRNFHSLEEIKSRAALYGWVFKSGIRVIIYYIDNFNFDLDYMKKNKDDRLLDNVFDPVIQTIRKHLNSKFKSYYIQHSKSIIFLIEYNFADEKNCNSSIEQINKRINADIKVKTGYTTTIGIGNYKADIGQASKSYSEAKLAIKIGHFSGKKDCTIFYNDLGIYRFLFEICINNRAVGQSFVKDTLMPLVKYDQQHNADLCQTLTKIVEKDWNLQKTSEELHIHYNTVKYRFKRIEKILNLDFSEYGDKLKIGIAICLKNMV